MIAQSSWMRSETEMSWDTIPCANNYVWNRNCNKFACCYHATLHEGPYFPHFSGNNVYMRKGACQYARGGCSTHSVQLNAHIVSHDEDETRNSESQRMECVWACWKRRSWNIQSECKCANKKRFTLQHTQTLPDTGNCTYRVFQVKNQSWKPWKFSEFLPSLSEMQGGFKRLVAQDSLPPATLPIQSLRPLSLGRPV